MYPFLDGNEIIRSNSRLAQAEYLDFNSKFLILLPRNNELTKIIVRYYHKSGFHNIGINGTLANLSVKYWIIAGREEIKSWINECNQCKILKTKSAIHIMAPLPKEILGQSMKAFDDFVLDFAGPFLTKSGRGKAKNKQYLCLFTCMATRAVYLEWHMILTQTRL